QDAAKRVDTILDFIATLATDSEASPDNNPVAEAAHQIESAAEMQETGAITPEAFREAFDRIQSRLSEPERQDLHHHFQVKSIILHDITNQPSPNEAAPTEPASAELPSPTQDSRLKTPDSSSNLQRANEAAAPIESAPTEPTSPELPSPTLDSRLKTQDSPSNFQPSTFNLQPTSTPDSPSNVSTPPPTPDSRLKTPLTMVERPHALTGQRATATSTSTISLASCPSADATHPRSFDSTKSFKSW